MVKANIRVVHNSHFVGARIPNPLHTASENETVPLLFIFFAGSGQQVEFHFRRCASKAAIINL